MAALIRVMLPIYLALALWPLVVLAVVITLYLFALWIQLPRIHSRYGGLITADMAKRLGLILGLSLVGVIVGSILVFMAPHSDFPRSFAAQPVALVGLWISSCSTCAFVVATERTAGKVRKQEEMELDQVLSQSWASPAAPGR